MSEKWSRFIDNIKADKKDWVKIVHKPADNAIFICCAEKDSDDLMKQVHRFLAQNAFSEKKMVMEYGALRLLSVHRKDELSQLESTFADQQVRDGFCVLCRLYQHSHLSFNIMRLNINSLNPCRTHYQRVSSAIFC